MSQENLSKLDLFQIGILATFQGQKKVSKQSIIDSSPDDNRLILQKLRGLFSERLITYNESDDSFNFSNYGLG